MPKTKAQLAEERRQTGYTVAESQMIMELDCSGENVTWNSEKIFVDPVAASWSVKAELKRQNELNLWLTFDGPRSLAITSNYAFNLKIPGLLENNKSSFVRPKMFTIPTSPARVAELVKNKKLQLTFIMRIMYSGHPRLRQKVNSPTAHKDILLGNFRGLLESSMLADFKFVVKGKEFNVHRSVLAAASPMLLNMFTINMVENKTGESKIDHIEPEVFNDMLKFVYGGEIPENSDARQLYSAADYYQIETLKQICEREVHSSLTSTNALEIFAWAHPYADLEALKFDAWDIIKSKTLLRLGTHDIEISSLDGIKKIVDAALMVKKAIAEFKENLNVGEEDTDPSIVDSEIIS